jgi:DNA-binding transcriptional LysR family regulator
MDRRDILDLLVLQAVAEKGSFTRAAAALGRAQSGVSQSIRDLETRLGTALLNRSTRSISLTAAGERLLERAAPALRELTESLRDAATPPDAIAGTIRLTMSQDPAERIVAPVLHGFLEQHPSVRVEIDVSDRFEDIVDRRFDAGIRFGWHLEDDMVTVPLGPDISAAVVAAPNYIARHGMPQTIADLGAHECITYRTASHGDPFRWRLLRDGRLADIAVEGRITVNTGPTMIAAAVAGLGLGYTFEPFVATELASGTLVKCLDQACPTWPGYRLFYPGRHQKSAALSAFVDYLRARKAQASS